MHKIIFDISLFSPFSPPFAWPQATGTVSARVARPQAK
jgi:hypothetical protein